METDVYHVLPFKYLLVQLVNKVMLFW